MPRHEDTSGLETERTAVAAGRAPCAAHPAAVGRTVSRRHHGKPAGHSRASRSTASDRAADYGRGTTAWSQPGNGPLVVRPLSRTRSRWLARPAQKRQTATALSGDQRVALFGLACHGPTDVNVGITHWSAAELAYGFTMIHISEPTRLGMISYAVFCLKKKKKK